jgi:diguanylate cyclase (GGDEF)-like protein/PAS domain S-box-containing protein
MTRPRLHPSPPTKTTSRIGHWSYDVTTAQTVWSPELFLIFGRDPALGEPPFADYRRYLHPDDWPELEQAVAECAEHGTPYDLTLRILRDDQQYGHARVHGTVLAETDSASRRLVGFVQDVSDEQAKKAALTKSEAEFRLLIEHQTDLIVKCDADGRLLFVSPSYCEMFGKRTEELLGRRFMPLVHPDDRAPTEEALAALGSAPHRCYVEQRAMTVYGWRWLAWSDTAVLNDQGQVVAVVGAGRDVHARKLAEQELTRTQRLLELALDSAGIGTYVLHLKQAEVAVHPRYLAQLGYGPGEVRVTEAWWRDNVHPDDRARVSAETERVLRGVQDDFDAEYRLRHREGHWVWVHDHGRVFERHPDGTARAVTGLHIDVTARKEAELRLAYHAEHDPLTGLLNRRGMRRAIRSIHAQSLRGGRRYCIASLDLDRFKRVNDRYGHDSGDALLVAVAERLVSSTRQSDWVARWGGEEFLVLMPDTGLHQAQVLFERLREHIARTPFDAQDHRLHITLSAGIAANRSDHDDPDEVITRADAALYAAKQTGRNRVSLAPDADGDGR